MGVITIGKDGTVQIPEELLKQARLKAGAPVSLVVTEDGDIVIQSEERDPDQAWFWTEEWQRKEREADEDIAAGRVTRFLSDDEFNAELERRANQP